MTTKGKVRKGHVYESNGGEWRVSRLNEKGEPGPPLLAKTRAEAFKIIDSGACKAEWTPKKVYKIFKMAWSEPGNGAGWGTAGMVLQELGYYPKHEVEAETREEAERLLMELYKRSWDGRGPTPQTPLTIVEMVSGIEGGWK